MESFCTVFGPGFPHKLGQPVVLTFSSIAMNIIVLLLLFKKKKITEAQSVGRHDPDQGPADHLQIQAD
jgi:hypothetical protein